MNDLVYDLKENDHGDVVIQVDEDDSEPINVEVISDVVEKSGTKVPYPIIKHIVDISPDDTTIFIICDTDIVTTFNGVLTYYSVEFGTGIFGAFVMPDSPEDDHREISIAMSQIIREYLKILNNEAAQNAKLITDAINNSSKILNRERRPEMAMYDYYNMYRLSLLQMNIQSLADKIIQYNSGR